jgi:hypothetical protein
MASRVSTSRFLSAAVIAVTMLSLFRRRADGQVIAPPQGDGAPPYQRLRYEEDYLYLRDPARRSDPFDPVKYIPLNGDGDWYLSLGGEARARYEMYNNDRWNPAAPDDDGYLLQRYLLHADLHLGPPVRVFGELQSSLERWREGGPRPIDEDRLDVHQLFVDVQLPLDRGGRNELTLRVGRQEMLYGSARLITVRDYANIRRAFDAVRLLSRVGEWRADAFFSRPVENDPGEFDDWGLDDVKFWGVYATHPLSFLPGANVDLYYLGLDRPDAPFLQGKADERRHSIGGRVFGKRGAWDYNVEGTFQFGTFGRGDITAWWLASDTGYTFEGVPMTPRLGLNLHVISGDTNPGADDLGTFNALFPRAAYFGEIALVGAANIIDVHPSLDLHVTPQLTVSADWDVFWRYSTDDGIYDAGGFPLRPADGDARFIGHQPGVGISWQIDRHASLTAGYSHFFAGDFIKRSGPSADVDFAFITLQYRY